MRLSETELTEYVIAYPICQTDMINLADAVPSKEVLELCLKLITYGYNTVDCIAMIESAYMRRTEETGKFIQRWRQNTQ